MSLLAEGVRSWRTLGRRGPVWALLLVSGWLSGMVLGAGAPGLHDGDIVYGIDGSSYLSPWTNDQIISLQAWGETDPSLYSDVSFTAYGIYSAAPLVNSGAMDVNGVGGSALPGQASALAFVDAYGIFTGQSIAASNSGDLTIVARGGIAESAAGTADSHAAVYGISTQESVTNSGNITVTGIGGNSNNTGGIGSSGAHAYAYGIYSMGTLVNDGRILVTGTGGTAEGGGESFYSSVNADAEAFGLYGYDVDNTGDITVLAVGGNAYGAGALTSAETEAYGIYGMFGQVNNAGDITVTATGGMVDSEEGLADVFAHGIRAYGDVTNSGDIIVTANAQDGFASAYGIYMGGEGNGTLTNTGTIRVFGDMAYELYVASSTVTLVDTYNVTLDGDPEQPSIFVADGGTLDLNNATLTVTDVTGEGGTLWDTAYQLFGTSNEAMVEGNFGDVQAVNPDVTAVYDTQGTANAADDTVALGYAPEASETLASAAVEKRMVALAPHALNQHMTMNLMYDMLLPEGADDGSDDESDSDATGLSACQQAGGMFFQPHYTYIDKDNDPLGYQAGLWGASTGYTQCVNDSLLGLQLGYGRSNIDYTGAGYSSNSEEQDVVTTGFSGLTRLRPWIVRYGLTGFHGWHEYTGLTGLGLNERETASYHSYGGTGLLMVGRTLQRNRHVFLPEIGASWLWVHRESYTTDATDPSWDTTYSTLNDHDVWAEAALHWQSLYRYRKLTITPSASLGIHQLLTDGETEAWQSVEGAAPVRVEDQQDRTALALAGAVVLRSRHTALTLAYDGEYSSDIEQHSFWMKFKLRF